MTKGGSRRADGRIPQWSASEEGGMAAVERDLDLVDQSCDQFRSR